MPTYICNRFNRKANVPSRICECGALCKCIATKNQRYACPVHGETKKITLCDCRGCQKSYSILKNSNQRTRIFNTKGHSIERPDRPKFLAERRKYKSRHDDSGLPRHICPNCVVYNDSLEKRIDDLKIELDGAVQNLRVTLDRIPEGYAVDVSASLRDKIASLQRKYELEKSSILRMRRPISDVCHEEYLFKELVGHWELDEHKQPILFYRPLLVIEHVCSRCKDPILKQSGLERPYIWETVDRVISGYGDLDYTYLGTSSIDKKVSNEEFIKRQVRYYHLASYYKDCHSHEAKNVDESSNIKPDIGAV